MNSALGRFVLLRWALAAALWSGTALPLFPAASPVRPNIVFILADDLGWAEKHNLAAKEPARAAALREQLHTWKKAVGAREPKPNPDFKQTP